MYRHCAGFIVLGSIFAFSVFAETADAKGEKKPAVLWREADIASRDLLHGPGGSERVPGGPFVFVKEDLSASSPKFVVKDGAGRKWKVKLGGEAKSETSAARFVWAMGYPTDVNYFLPEAKVSNMPKRLWRGAKHVSQDGIVHDARWESMERDKDGLWHWGANPFDKTRELDGLRVLMALLNNFDLKDSQNSIYETPEANLYLVTDLGATFGRTYPSWPGQAIRSDIKWFSESKFITKVTDSYVDFAAPGWPRIAKLIPVPPAPFTMEALPLSFSTRKWLPNMMYQRWLGKRVPIENVRWIAGLLGQLTPEQIRDAFRAAHFSDGEVEEFSRVMETRIAELKKI